MVTYIISEAVEVELLSYCCDLFIRKTTSNAITMINNTNIGRPRPRPRIRLVLSENIPETY